MPPGEAQLALPFDAPPVPLDVRLRTMGLRDVAAIRTHRNRSVLVSLTAGACCGSMPTMPARPTT